ncbi:transposase [Burkholderia multivorans]|uniref:RNA-guided endonuclease TnpB family protein n=1 Tax=Burkholderia ubonensis TaxID=101571 RepID=UPI000F6DEBAE|nr:RNA-guided endonuclease TnpB family protein [Burkholderia ubonensis]AYZ62696.1 transposase [Burkholderia multivorans]VWB35672.1 transposase [Burkholderia ubonensis]
MDIKRAYRFRFYPTPEQAVMLARTFGCARFVYNHMLRMRTDAWHQRQERVGYHETSASLTALKQTPEHGWLNEVSSVPLQQALRHLQTAFANFFAKRAKLSTRLINENQVIAIESLAVSHMLKNRKLAKSISDAGWSEFVRQLTYKAKWYGRTLIGIDRWYPSSKRCADCGHTVASLPLKVRAWACPGCGMTHDRDINAARNVLAAGLAVSAHGESVIPMSL